MPTVCDGTTNMNLEPKVCICSCGCDKTTFDFEDSTIEHLKEIGYMVESIEKMDGLCSKCMSNYINYGSCNIVYGGSNIA